MQGEQQTKKDKKVTTPIRQPDASATGSSFGGSEGGSLGNGRSNNVKHFNERERIQEVVRLYSTLESQGGSGGNEDEDYVEELKYQALDKSPDQSRSGAYQYKNTFHSQQQHDQDGVHQNFRILTRLKSFLIGRLFKFNHVILNYQSVTTYIYLAYLLIELIEMLFYVFYKVEIANEFTRPIVESLFAVSGSVGNSGTELLEPETGSNSDFLDLYDPSLEELADLSDANSALNQEQITESTFEIAQYFTFLNFQLYPLQTHSFKGFLALYLTLNVTFYALLIVIYGLGDRLFMMAKRDEIKDMYKYGTKALSVIMASYLFIFQIPMVSINLQGYLCEEDPDDIYVLENVECGSVSNQIMVVFSTVTLILYISFLFIQTMIYNSCDFETSIPWASVEDSHSHARVIWKLIISFGFMFDKAGEYRQIVSFISAAFGLLISYHRLTSAQIFNRSVHYLSVASDLLASWLYICLPIHQYFSSEISVASLVTIVLCGSVLIIVCVVFSEMRNQHEIIHAQCDEETIKARSPSQAHRIIYQLTRLIISANESDKLMLQGLLYSHIAECKNQKCSCDEFTLEFDEKALRIAMEQKGIDLFGLKKQMVSKYFSDTHFTNTNAASVVDQKQSGAFPVSFGNLSSDVLNNQALNITGGQKSAEGQGGSQLNTREIKIHQFEGLANPPSALASNDREFLDSNRGQRGVNQLVVGESGQRTSWYERYQNNPVQNAFGLQDIGGALSSIPVNDDSLLTSHRLASARNQLSGIGKQPSDKDAPAPLVASNLKLIEVPSYTKQKDASHIAPLKSPAFGGGQTDQILEDYHVENKNHQLNDHKRSQKIVFPPHYGEHSQAHNFESNSGNDLPTVAYFNQQHTIAMREHEAPREVSVNSIPTDEINLPEEESTLKYRFLQLFIDKSIKKFPNSVSLHIQSSYFQSTKLKNEFKAMFELMKCEMMMNPSFQNKFFIFRHRIAVESILLAMSDSNVKQGERVDPKRIYQVERLTLKLQKLQYLTASSILAFWRELLQREIDPQVLRQRGGEILRTGEHLQLALDQINAADRENIKFLLGYCIFQKMVMSNESEAFAYFERAQNIMIRQTQVKKSGKGRSGSSIGKSVNGETPIFEVNERETYGDNTACAIVILSLSADSKGIIIHANDEVTRVLGYQRKNIIGCNVNIIQPKPFSGFHDRLLKRFLDSSKRTMINHSRQSFAKSAQDYLVPVQLLIKLYPMMTDKITVIGFIQALQKIDGLDGGSAKMESTVSSGLAQSYDTADQSLKYKIHHYIITDQDGNIQCVSEGLSRETGLNKRLFLGTDGFSTTFNIKKLFHVNFQLDESEEAMLNSPEGFETVLITDSVINDANVEFLAPEELEDMRRKKGSYAVNIMHRLIEVDANIPPVDYYRIVFLPPNVESIKQSKLSTQLKGGALSPNGSGAQKQLNSSAHEKSDGDSTGFNGSDPNNNFNNGSASISSTASGHSRSTGTSITMSKVIQEFKNSISRRQTPRHLIKMGRLLGLVIIATIAISCVDFNQKLLYVAESEDLCDVLSHSHQRHTQLIQLFMNIRESHDLITQNRATFLSEELSKQEKRNENLYKLTQQMTVDSDVIPFRFAMNPKNP